MSTSERNVRKRLLVAKSVLLLVISCGQGLDDIGSSNEPRAIWVLRQSRIGIGQMSVVERVVVTPPQFRPETVRPPPSLAGLSIIDTRELPAEESTRRWIHRTQLRLRADSIGRVEWPAERVSIQGPGASDQSLPLPAFSIEVRSIRPEFADRSAPFGLRQPDAALAMNDASDRARRAALVVLAALAGLVLLLFCKRLAQRLRLARASRAEPTLPWQTARSSIARASAIGESDPVAAAHALSPALRHYMAARYGADTQGRTCEELSGTEPAFAMRSSWPPFATLVSELDSLRFQATENVREQAAARLPGWLEAATRCVERTLPPEHRE